MSKTGYMSSFNHFITYRCCGYPLSTNRPKMISTKKPSRRSSSQKFYPKSSIPPARLPYEVSKSEIQGPSCCTLYPHHHSESLETEKSQYPESVKDLPKGGFWRRSLAFSLDILFIRLLKSMIFFAVQLGFMTGAGIMGLNTETFLDLRASLVRTIGYLLIAIYFIYFHATTGQTPGKWIFGLKVIKTNGRPLGFITSLERFLGYFISALPLCMGFLMICFDRQKQAVHDLITWTYVIKTG